MKLIKIDETLIEIPDHNYTELVSLHKKAFGSYDSYIISQYQTRILRLHR